MGEPTSDSWRLDKRIPWIALLIAVVAQTFAFGWWAATMSSRMTAIEDRQTEANAARDKWDIAFIQIATDIATLKANTASSADQIRELKLSFDRLSSRLMVDDRPVPGRARDR